MSAWLILAVSILLEVSGTTLLKLSAGFERLLPSILSFVAYLASIATFNIALRSIDLGIAYAIWAGTGTAIVTLIGIFAFGEGTAPIKLTFISFIIIGVVGLNLVSQAQN